MRSRVVLTLALALTGGCATITSAPTETITVMSDPSGANVWVDCGSEKSAQITPAHFLIARKSSDCMVTVEKTGFEKETVVLEQGVNRLAWGNVPIAATGIGVLGMSGFSDNPNNSARVGAAIALFGLGGLVVDRITWRLRDHDPKTLSVKLRPSQP